MGKNRAADRFRQAENGLVWARDTRQARHYAQACFICQHVGEKALKALAHSLNIDMVKSHSITAIARSLDINGRIEELGKKLDLYYISTRYPDAFPEGAPFEYFTDEQAGEAITLAGEILDFVRERLDGV